MKLTNATYPPQITDHIDRRVEVMVGGDQTRIVYGRIVRDDEDGKVTIILLDDGRYFLPSECIYSIL